MTRSRASEPFGSDRAANPRYLLEVTPRCLMRSYDIKTLRRQLAVAIPEFERPRTQSDFPGLIELEAHVFHTPNHHRLEILTACLCHSSLGIANSRLRNQRYVLQSHQGASRSERAEPEAKPDADSRRNC